MVILLGIEKLRRSKKTARYGIFLVIIVLGVTAVTTIPVSHGFSEKQAISRGIAPNAGDNVFWFSRLMGGGGEDEVWAVTLDSQNSIVLTGWTGSTDFPALNAYQSAHSGGNTDAVVAKLSSNGSLVWSTFLGGSSGETAYGITIDSQDNVIVVGETSSEDFPTLNAYNSTHSGSSDVYITKFSPTGALIWSTYLGGNESEMGSGVCVDSLDNIIVTGATDSTDFPLLGANNHSYSGSSDVFITKFSSSGSLIWSTYRGGADQEWGFSVAADSFDNIVVMGETSSGDFPIANAHDPTYNGGNGDAFAMKTDSNGLLLWSTYLGGSSDDSAGDLVVDKQDNAIVTGHTNSFNFPTVNGYDSTYNSLGTSDAYVTKFSTSGSILWSTFLGGNASDWSGGIAVDGQDNVIVGGQTESLNFPIVNAFFPTHNGGRSDVFLSNFSHTGSLAWSSYLGGSDSDIDGYVAVDTFGHIIVTGRTASYNDPLRNHWVTSAFPVTMDRVTGTGPNGTEANEFLGSWEIFISSFLGPTAPPMDTTSPTIDQPADVYYEEGATGHAITWHPSDLAPASYALYRNGLLIETGNWTGGVLTFNLDGLNPGIYNYTLAVYDEADNSAKDTVIVYVTASTPEDSSSEPSMPEESSSDSSGSASEEPSVGAPGFGSVMILFSLGIILIRIRWGRTTRATQGKFRRKPSLTD